MVKNERESGRVSEETEVPEADPTLDIVRRLIVDAEALPAPARRAPGPATPRPGAGPAGAGPISVPLSAPTSAPEHKAEPETISDAVPEAWDDEPEDEGWDDLAIGAGSRPYGIVDLETGAVVDLEGAEVQGDVASAAPRRARKRLLRRWLGGAIRLLWAWARAGIGAGARVVAQFLRRPEAPRRLATALLVIFVIAWPFKVIWLTLLIPLAALVTWASVGNDGCAELVVGWHSRLGARDPDKAERIRLRAAALSRALTRGLDRLPERWTQGLYLPDFEPEGYVPEKLQVDPFEDLAARVHSAKRAGGG